MEISLYQKDIGFYSSGETRTGTQGDFLTPVSTGPVLGQLLALQIIELLQSLKNPTSFHLVEQGADQGHLALDILSSLDQNAIGDSEKRSDSELKKLAVRLRQLDDLWV